VGKVTIEKWTKLETFFSWI